MARSTARAAARRLRAADRLALRGLLALAVASIALLHGAGPTARADEGDQLYRDGHYELGVAHWRARAEAGDMEAAYRLGATLSDGVVVQQDLAEAARWLEQAATGGHLAAQAELGALYDNGWGVPRSPSLAARWYRSAAVRGEMASQFNLASMYEQGQGVERSPAAAYHWYHLALRQGMGPLARAGIQRIAGELSDEEKRAIVARAPESEAAYDEAEAPHLEGPWRTASP